MKIDYVILSSDKNPFYLDFWEPVSLMWREKIGIKPILAFIGDQDQIVDHGTYIIHEIKTLPDIPVSFQAQVIRLYLPKYYKKANCLISDIDTMPLNKDYFCAPAASMPEGEFLVYNGAAYPGRSRVPICFNLASGDTYTKMLRLESHDSFASFCKFLLSLKLDRIPPYWNVDELYLGLCLQNAPPTIRISQQNASLEYKSPSEYLLNYQTQIEPAPFAREVPPRYTSPPFIDRTRLPEVLEYHGLDAKQDLSHVSPDILLPYVCAHLERPQSWDTDKLIELYLKEEK